MRHKNLRDANRADVLNAQARMAASMPLNSELLLAESQAGTIKLLQMAVRQGGTSLRNILIARELHAITGDLLGRYIEGQIKHALDAAAKQQPAPASAIVGADGKTLPQESKGESNGA
jgi:hypothetical protein